MRRRSAFSRPIQTVRCSKHHRMRDLVCEEHDAGLSRYLGVPRAIRQLNSPGSLARSLLMSSLWTPPSCKPGFSPFGGKAFPSACPASESSRHACPVHDQAPLPLLRRRHAASPCLGAATSAGPVQGGRGFWRNICAFASPGFRKRSADGSPRLIPPAIAAAPPPCSIEVLYRTAAVESLVASPRRYSGRELWLRVLRHCRYAARHPRCRS